MTLTTEPLNDSRLPRWKTRIVTKFLLLALPFFIVISFTWLTFAPRWYRNLALKHLEDKAESMGEIAAYSLAPAIVFEDIKNIKEIITNISQSREIEYILVFDAKGRELYQYFKSPSVRPTKQQMKLTGLSSDGQIWNLYTEIRHREETVGYLALGFSLRHMEAQVSRINRLILITSGIIFLLGILTLYALSLLITRPLRKMARTVEDISRGNLDQRIEIKTHDEVGQLARMFNSTLDELQKVMRHLQEAKDNLEKRVEERTAELKQQVEEKEALAQKLKESEELFRDIVETMGEAVV
ncbi:MAG: HAMP domain-containing protein, partial [Candidatus Saccharicenans sp.]